MNSKVALVEINGDINKSYKKALRLIGGIEDLNNRGRDVVIKAGIFDHKWPHYTSKGVMDAIVHGFNKAPHIFIAESDSSRGKARERLSIYKDIYSKRVIPKSLSDDVEIKEARVADERFDFSRVLFKPNVFVSTHVLRNLRVLDNLFFSGASWGSIIKNLLGIIPDHRKARFHKKLPQLLLDAYEAIGGIDLAVMDGRYAHLHFSGKNKIKANLLIVGRDAIAVDAVGAALMDIPFSKMPVLMEAKKRNIGTWDIENIDVVGASLEENTERIQKLKMKKLKSAK